MNLELLAGSIEGEGRKESLVVDEVWSRNLRQRQRSPKVGLVFSFFPFFALDLAPARTVCPDELETRVKPCRGSAPFEFVTPGIEQHRDRSDATRYNSFSILPPKYTP